MVQKYCPTCKDLIPVACKSCPCGHKFVKTIPDSVKTDQPGADNGSTLGREANGRPRRRSAMNSLYYHSSLHVSSYKLARHAAVISVKRRSSTEKNSTDTPNGESVENGTDHSTTNGQTTRKRRRGRPRLTPLTESEVEAEKEAEKEAESNKTKEEDEDDYPTLRQRRPGLIYNTLRSSRDIYDHPSHSATSNSKTSKSNRAINESESFGKLYQTLSQERKAHFALILTDINFKFKRNANFPL